MEALVIVISKWAQTPSSFARLNFGDRSKLGATRTKNDKYKGFVWKMKKREKTLRLFTRCIIFSEKSHKTSSQEYKKSNLFRFLKFLVFWVFLGSRKSNFGPFSGKSPFLGQNDPKNTPKIKNSKIEKDYIFRTPMSQFCVIFQKD